MQLQSNVIISYTDISAGGCKALLGLSGHDTAHIDDDTERHLTTESMKAACVIDNEDLRPILATHYLKQDVSVIVINSIVNENNLTLLANKIMDLCSSSGVQRLFIVTVLRVHLPYDFTDNIYENSYHGKQVTKLKSLPEDTKITDPFFLTLMQLIQVEGIPTSCLIVPGYRGKYETAEEQVGPLQAVKVIQGTIGSLFDLQFDFTRSQSLIYRGNPATDDDPVAAMYG